jgi:hypothetical protein
MEQDATDQLARTKGAATTKRKESNQRSEQEAKCNERWFDVFLDKSTEKRRRQKGREGNGRRQRKERDGGTLVISGRLFGNMAIFCDETCHREFQD